MKKNSILTLAAAFVAGIAVVGCSTSAEDFSEEITGTGAKLKIKTFATSSSEADYAHKAFLVSGDNIAEAKSGANAAALTAFSVEPGSYAVYATAANDEANLTFSGIAATDAVAAARIKITDMSAQIPELLVGNSESVTVSDAGATANIQLKRVVASINVTVNGLENVDASTITLKIDNMYDQVALDGSVMKSGEAFASKTITLTKNSATGKFEGNAIVMPTDADAATLALTYAVNGTEYTSTPTAKIAANGQYNLTTTVSGGSTLQNLASSITYKAWDAAVSLSDSFTIEEETPAKQWTSAALAIGGTDNGKDNFWASSQDQIWDGSYQAISYLYDGVKDSETQYWCPQQEGDGDTYTDSTPTWYINLGKACEGVQLDYWNKAGGKGGQKIKTMDIYGSNTKADYEGGNTDWVKIKTFTSDKTTPTTHAGAQVTTDKIAFAEDGTTSYQYIKCVITSKVNPDGATDTESLDVSVGELEITTWSYK